MKRQWILITVMALTLVTATTMFGCQTETPEAAIPAAAQPQRVAPASTGTEPALVATYPLGVPPSGPPLFEIGLWPQSKSAQPASTTTAAVLDGNIVIATYPLGVPPSGLPLVDDWGR